MNFKPYHLLIQLIPGVLLIGVFVLGNTEVVGKELSLQLSDVILFTGLAFIAGYTINGFGHFLEGFWRVPLNRFFKSEMEQWDFVKDDNKAGIIATIIIYFSAVRRDKSMDVESYKKHDLEWTKDEKKFSRTLIFCSIILLFYVPFAHRHSILHHHECAILTGLALLAFVSLYRYLTYTVDYLYKKAENIKRDSATPTPPN